MSTVKANNNAVEDRSIKEVLMGGAKVDFSHNGSEMVYTIEGVRGLEISTQGYIIDKGDKKYPKESNDTVYITARKGFKAINIAYKSLILLLNGYVPKGGIIIDTIDADKGYRPDNIVIKSKFSKAEIDFNTLERTGTVVESKEPKVVKGADVAEEDKTIIDPATVYTQKTPVLEYVAEDGMAFETLESAAIHQRAVAAAKEVAQVVLDYNKGLYGIAEQAYLKVLPYENDVKPYQNFVDVMNNFDGVQQRTAKEVVQFKKFAKGQEPIFAHLFSNKSYNQETANEILEYLAMVQDIRIHLEGLSKQNVV